MRHSQTASLEEVIHHCACVAFLVVTMIQFGGAVDSACRANSAHGKPVACCPGPTGPLDLMLHTDFSDSAPADPNGFPCLRQVGTTSSATLGDGSWSAASVRCVRTYNQASYDDWSCVPDPPGYIPIYTTFRYSVTCRRPTEDGVLVVDPESSLPSATTPPPMKTIATYGVGDVDLVAPRSDDTIRLPIVSPAVFSHLSCSIVYSIELSSQWEWSMVVLMASAFAAVSTSILMIWQYPWANTVALCGLYSATTIFTSSLLTYVLWVRDDMSRTFMTTATVLHATAFIVTSWGIVYLIEGDADLRRAQSKKTDEDVANYLETGTMLSFPYHRLHQRRHLLSRRYAHKRDHHRSESNNKPQGSTSAPE